MIYVAIRGFIWLSHKKNLTQSLPLATLIQRIVKLDFAIDSVVDGGGVLPSTAIHGLTNPLGRLRIRIWL